MHVHTARCTTATTMHSRCNVRLDAPVYRSQRAAQGYHYGGSRHSLLIAGFQREFSTRTYVRSQLRSLAIIIFSAARKDARTRSERAQKYAYTREQNTADNTRGVFHFQNAAM